MEFCQKFLKGLLCLFDLHLPTRNCQMLKGLGFDINWGLILLSLQIGSNHKPKYLHFVFHLYLPDLY